MLLAKLSSNAIIGTSMLVVGLVFCALFIFLHYYLKMRRNRQNFRLNNKESEGVWEFTKKNFMFFTGLFFFVIAVAGFMMLIS